MTTILGCTTPDFVVMASDRAVSYQTSPNVYEALDRMTKTVLIHGQFLMGFTGFAELEGLPVDEWILEALVGVDPRQWPEHLRAKASAAVGRVHKSRLNKHHTFAAVGFAASAPDPNAELRPMRLIISNAYGKEGNLLTKASPDFRVRREYQPSGEWAYIDAYGQRPSDKFLRETEKALGKYQKHKEGSANGAIELLARLVAGVALNSPTVSRACLVSVLPRVALGTTGFALPVGSNDPQITDDAVTCVTYPGDDLQRVFFLPNMVLPGGQTITKGAILSPEGAPPPPGPFDNRPK